MSPGDRFLLWEGGLVMSCGCHLERRVHPAALVDDSGAFKTGNYCVSVHVRHYSFTVDSLLSTVDIMLYKVKS